MTGRATTLALQRQEAPQGESLLALIKEDVAPASSSAIRPHAAAWKAFCFILASTP